MTDKQREWQGPENPLAEYVFGGYIAEQLPVDRQNSEKHIRQRSYGDVFFMAARLFAQ
jgi:hypothetical protein